MGLWGLEFGGLLLWSVFSDARSRLGFQKIYRILMLMWSAGSIEAHIARWRWIHGANRSQPSKAAARYFHQMPSGQFFRPIRAYHLQRSTVLPNFRLLVKAMLFVSVQGLQQVPTCQIPSVIWVHNCISRKVLQSRAALFPNQLAWARGLGLLTWTLLEALNKAV